LDTTAPTTVALGEAEYEVVIPGDYCTVQELALFANANPVRGMAAVLGLCLPGLQMAAHYERHGFSVGRFGGWVWERLAKRGISPVQIAEAGQELYPALLVRAYPSDEEVAGAVGFSSPTAGGSDEKPSGSPASGDNQIPTGSGA